MSDGDSPRGTARNFFATTARGTEAVLAEELGELGVKGIEATTGGVRFAGVLEDGYRACAGSRVASRVLLSLHSFEADDADSLYAGVASIPWTEHLGPEGTFAVDVAGRGAAGPAKFVALKAKDAIVDVIRDAEGTRPNVDKAEPGLRIHVHLAGEAVTLSIDLAGKGLHRRGFGREGGAAPMKENLAAALLRMAGWHERARAATEDAVATLVDPMCGSGTFLLEAAAIARDDAPGLHRPFGAPDWRGHDAESYAAALAALERRRAAAKGRKIQLIAFDGSDAAVDRARQNVERAGILVDPHATVRIRRAVLADLAAPEGAPGLVVINPPYGERLGAAGELFLLYGELGDVLKHRFPGWSAWVLSGNRSLDKRIGLRPSSKREVMNGKIDCRWLEFPLREAPAPDSKGPGWRKPRPEAEMFANRLRKNAKKAGKWLKRARTDAYRVYDADIPEFNLSVDIYGDAVRVEEYQRPRSITNKLAQRRLEDAILVVMEVFELGRDDISVRVRQRRADGEQEERRGDMGRMREVHERDLTLLVNLDDYLDTGLFLDDRRLRENIEALAKGKRFLNLFSYTCAASAAAAAGGARSTTSVDLSGRYLDWGKRNFEASGLADRAHQFVRDDVLEWLHDARRRRDTWDLILLAPPTWSRSKRMRNDFDVQRDHGRLIRDAVALLAPGGQLIFTTNLRSFEVDRRALGGLALEDITTEMTTSDFARSPRFTAYRITKI